MVRPVRASVSLRHPLREACHPNGLEHTVLLSLVVIPDGNELPSSLHHVLLDRFAPAPVRATETPPCFIWARLDEGRHLIAVRPAYGVPRRVRNSVIASRSASPISVFLKKGMTLTPFGTKNLIVAGVRSVRSVRTAETAGWPLY